MKTIEIKKYIFLTVVLVTICTLEVKSQIKVIESGYVGVGTTTPNCHFQLGPNDTYNSRRTSLGAELRICRYNSSWPMAFIQARDNTTNEIGLRFRTQNSLGSVVDAMHIFGNGNIIYYYSLTKSSDIRLKDNISSVDRIKIDKLYELNAVEYDIKPIDTTVVSSKQFLDEKAKKKMYGFIAQDMEKILPDFVYSNVDNYKSIDYISLIPLLVEALKEQKEQIEKLEEKVKSDSKSNSTTKNENANKSTPNSKDSNFIEDAILYQNSPNPFSEKTEIRYSIPQSTTSAFIYIFNMQGSLIENIPIVDLGNGFLTIDGYQYNPGMYIYSLLVDGQEIDSKRMILTE